MRPEIRALAAYRQGKSSPVDAFKLSSNENPFEPIPAVLRAIEQSAVNRYPDATAAVLRSRLAAKYGVGVGEVHIGAGSVSILAQLIQATSGPGDEVVYAWRSFEAYPGLVTIAGATSVKVPNLADHRHDVTSMVAAVTERTRVILLCSPNNPTGTILTEAELTDFMAAVPPTVLVILDEAYAEFASDPARADGVAARAAYPNLVLLRTFSKAYGLAGLRIG
ncbi:MAG: aminotransferase class I/II-fold pyridoxal phosphate-dependent enzyme, partial [Microbacteriaceae bacterium]